MTAGTRPDTLPLAPARAHAFTFHRDEDGGLSLEAAVFQALGAASSCWDDLRNAGVFDSTRAEAIGGALLEVIRAEPAAEPVTTQEWCVQYRCLPQMTDWQVWSGSLRHGRRWADEQLEDLRAQEFNPNVEYRTAVRTVGDWQAAQ